MRRWVTLLLMVGGLGAVGYGVFRLYGWPLTLAFAVTILQYNLRSSIRLLLYAVAVDLTFRLVMRWNGRKEVLVTSSP